MLIRDQQLVDVISIIPGTLEINVRLSEDLSLWDDFYKGQTDGIYVEAVKYYLTAIRSNVSDFPQLATNLENILRHYRNLYVGNSTERISAHHEIHTPTLRSFVRELNNHVVANNISPSTINFEGCRYDPKSGLLTIWLLYVPSIH